jgi:hypothetical protein
MNQVMRARPEVDQVLEYMRKSRVSFADLIGVGGEDLKSANSIRREKAKRVENTWSLMARHGLVFADLEKASG